MVAGPIVLFYGILRIAKRRADALPDSGAPDAGSLDSDPGDVRTDG